jgi:hypothetical protein
MTEQRTPTLDQVITRAIKAWAGERAQVFIAQVTAYDRTTQRAEVQPVNRAYYGDDETGEYRDWSGVLFDVPVVMPSFGQWVIVADLVAGDYVLCVVSTRSIDEWKVNGGTNLDAQDVRLCMLDDAIAIPGLWPNPDALGSDVARADELVLSRRDGSTQLRITDGEVIVTAASVKLGGPAASDLVALSSKVDAYITLLDTVLKTGWVVVPTDGGAALKAAYIAATTTAYPPSGVPSSTAATKTKAE